MNYTLSLLPLLLSLSACGQPEVTICEDFIKTSLKSPSSYKKAKVTILDEDLSLKQLIEDHSDAMGFEKDAAKEGRMKQRLVAIEYDADNSFGASLRGAGICEFHLKDGQLPDEATMQSSMRLAASSRSLRELASQGLIPDQSKMNLKEPKYACCEN